MEKQQNLFAIAADHSETKSPKSKTAGNEKKPALAAKHSFTIYLDGASRGNPGPAGAGIYMLFNGKPFAQHGFYLGKKTNNQAEYMALVLAVLLVKQATEKDGVAYSSIAFISDSELLIKQMKGIYRVKNEVLALLQAFIIQHLQGITCSFTHVLRHKNVHADQLANDGIDKKQKIPTTFAKILSHYGL